MLSLHYTFRILCMLFDHLGEVEAGDNTDEARLSLYRRAFLLPVYLLLGAGSRGLGVAALYVRVDVAIAQAYHAIRHLTSRQGPLDRPPSR